MSKVFLDTIGLVALWDEADERHAAAEAAFAQITAQRWPFVTTTFVLLKCGNTAALRPYRYQVCQLRDKLEKRNELIVPTTEDWDASWAAYERGEAEQAGIVEQISFAVMRRLGIEAVFTSDHHFQAAGFTLLF